MRNLILLYTLGLALMVSAAERPVSFRHDVLPVLSKAGCNSGGCHGALAGKNGFRLSLNAYDPKTDHYNITREMRGRRVEFNDPARSLFLIKPSAAVRHKGGKVLHEDSKDYQLLLKWIQHGAPPPTDQDAKLTRVELTPSNTQVKKGDKRQLKVTAHFSDGTKRNVTPWAKFDSTDASVAIVDEKTGMTEVIGFGQNAITAWYSGRIAIARLTSPWLNKIPTEVYAKAEQTNLIDQHVITQLRQLNLKPSPTCTDSEFIRRIYLDVIGVLPTTKETRDFLANKAKDKRAKLADQLLARP